MRSFAIGEVVASKGAMQHLDKNDVAEALLRFSNHDWGDLSKEDWNRNRQALKSGGKIIGLYHSNGYDFYIITEHDRSVTTICLVDEH